MIIDREGNITGQYYTTYTYKYIMIYMIYNDIYDMYDIYIYMYTHTHIHVYCVTGPLQHLSDDQLFQFKTYI